MLFHFHPVICIDFCSDSIHTSDIASFFLPFQKTQHSALASHKQAIIERLNCPTCCCLIWCVTQVVWELCRTVLSHTLTRAFTILCCQYRPDPLGDRAECMSHLEKRLFMHCLSLGFSEFCLCHRDKQCLRVGLWVCVCVWERVVHVCKQASTYVCVCVCVCLRKGQQRLMIGWRNKAQSWK